MLPISENLIQSVPTAAVAIVAIWALVEVIKSRKQKNGWNKKAFEELQLINNNHLNSIQKAIYESNEKIVRAINDGNRQIIELLGEIKGSLR